MIVKKSGWGNYECQKLVWLLEGAKVFYAKDHDAYRVSEWQFNSPVKAYCPCRKNGYAKVKRWYFTLSVAPYHLMYVEGNDPNIEVTEYTSELLRRQ